MFRGDDHHRQLRVQDELMAFVDRLVDTVIAYGR
jgi:hypothetical protein